MKGMIGYQFEGFVFWPEVRALEFPDGKFTNPSSVHCDLLLVFVRKPSCDLSFDQLIKESGSQVNLPKDTLAHRVYELRDLIEIDPRDPKLFTKVRGFGFRFNAAVRTVELIDKNSPAVVTRSQYADKVREIEDLRKRNRALETENRLLKIQNQFIMLASLTEPERARRVFDIVRWSSERLIGSEQEVQIRTLEMIKDYIQEALNHYRRTSSSRELELAANLGRFWMTQGQYSKGSTILQSAISRHSDSLSDSLAVALAWSSNLLNRLCDYESASQVATRCIQVSKETGNDESLALALSTLGGIALHQGHYGQAVSHLNDSLKVAQRTNIGWLEAWALSDLGVIAKDRENYLAAERLYSKSLKIREEIGDARGVSFIHGILSIVACYQGNTEQARILADQSMEGLTAPRQIGIYHSSLGLMEASSGTQQASFDNFRKSLQLRQQIGDRRDQARSLEGMAMATYSMGNDGEAAGLYGSADQIRQAISAPLSPAEKKSHHELSRSLRKKYPAVFERGSERLSEILRS